MIFVDQFCGLGTFILDLNANAALLAGYPKYDFFYNLSPFLEAIQPEREAE